jgi:hypothetical protein
MTRSLSRSGRARRDQRHQAAGLEGSWRGRGTPPYERLSSGSFGALQSSTRSMASTTTTLTAPASCTLHTPPHPLRPRDSLVVASYLYSAPLLGQQWLSASADVRLSASADVRLSASADVRLQCCTMLCMCVCMHPLRGRIWELGVLLQDDSSFLWFALSTVLLADVARRCPSASSPPLLAHVRPRVSDSAWPVSCAEASHRRTTGHHSTTARMQCRLCTLFCS